MYERLNLSIEEISNGFVIELADYYTYGTGNSKFYEDLGKLKEDFPYFLDTYLAVQEESKREKEEAAKEQIRKETVSTAI